MLSLFVSTSFAKSPELNLQLDSMIVKGEGTYKYFWMSIYDARLFSAEEHWSYQKPFALSLTYHRNLKGKAIAQRSIKEIRGQGFDDENKLQSWYQHLVEIFPDVEDGSTLTGLFLPNQGVHFYYQDQSIGMIQEELFAYHFFGIWLSEQTSAPSLRQALLGDS